MNLDLPITDFRGTTRAFQDTAKSVVPAGAIVQYGGAKAPDGWLLCNASIQDRRADYPELSRIYPGSGTTFSVPTISNSIIKV